MDNLMQFEIGLILIGIWAFVRYLQTRTIVELYIEMFRQSHGIIIEQKRSILQPVYKWAYGVYDKSPTCSYSNYVGMRFLIWVCSPLSLTWIVFSYFFPVALPFAIVFVGTMTWFLFMLSITNSRDNSYLTSFVLDLASIKEYYNSDKYIDI